MPNGEDSDKQTGDMSPSSEKCWENCDSDDSRGGYEMVGTATTLPQPFKVQRSNSTADELYNNFLLPEKVSRYSVVQDRSVVFPVTFKEKLFLVLDDPQCCVLAKYVSISMMVVIILSCVIYVVSTDPSIRHSPSSCDKPACDNDPNICPNEVICEPIPPEVFYTIETCCIVVFTVDYGLRVLLVSFMPPRISGVISVKEEELEFEKAMDQAKHLLEEEKAEKQSKEDDQTEEQVELAKQLVKDPYIPAFVKQLRYMRQLMNVIDVVAIVPFYVEQSTSSGSSIAIVRVLRLARMLRIFKASKYNEGTRLLSETIWRSIPALSLLFFFTALGVVLFGSLIYFMEGGKFEVTAEYPHGAYMRTDVVGVSEVSPYTSIPVSCYWVIVTATTVGFGDLYPTSSGGRFVACICMYIGLLVLALPITVVGSNFSMVYEEKQEIDDEKERLQAARSDEDSVTKQTEATPERKSSISSMASIDLDELMLTDPSSLALFPTPGKSSPSRRNLSKSSSLGLNYSQNQQQLTLMKHQIVLQQALMRQLQEMKTHVPNEKLLLPFTPQNSTLKKKLKIKKSVSLNKVKFKRKSSDSSDDNSDIVSSNRRRALSLDISCLSTKKTGISPLAPTDLIFSPPLKGSRGNHQENINSDAALKFAMLIRGELDVLISHIQQQQEVIGDQHEIIARQDAEIALLKGEVYRNLSSDHSANSTQLNANSGRIVFNRQGLHNTNVFDEASASVANSTTATEKKWNLQVDTS